MKQLKAIWRTARDVFFSDRFGLILAGWAVASARHDFAAGNFWFGVIGVMLGAVIGVWAWRDLGKAMRTAARP